MPDYPLFSYSDVYNHAKAVVASGYAVGVRQLRRGALREGYFSDPRRFADELSNHDGPDVVGSYYMDSPLPLTMLKRIDNYLRFVKKEEKISAVDTDVMYRRSITFDIDPVRDANTSSTDVEHERAILKAHDIAITMQEWYGWPAPTIIDSGNGAHLRWPVRLENDNKSTLLVKACLYKAAAMFDDEHVKIDTSVSNAGRIWRIPGTPARKGAHTSERPHRLCHVIASGDALSVLTAERLTIFAGMALASSGGASPGAREPTSPPSPSGPKFRSLDQRAFSRLDDWVPVLFPDAEQTNEGWDISSEALGRDDKYEERISFHKKGIKDWGLADMGDPRGGKRTPIEIVAEHHHVEPQIAAAMLAEVLEEPVLELGPLEPPPTPVQPFTDPNGGLGSMSQVYELDESHTRFIFSDAMHTTYDDPPFLHMGVSAYGMANWRIASPKTGKTVMVYEETLRGLMGLPMYGQLMCEVKADWAILYAFEDNPRPARTLLRRQYFEICKDTGSDGDEDSFNEIMRRIAIICPYSREFQDMVMRGDLPDMNGGDYLASIDPLCKTAKSLYGPNGVVVVDTFEEMTGFLNGTFAGNPAVLDMAKVSTLNIKALMLNICMLVTHHLTKMVGRGQGGNAASYIAGTYGIESKLNNYITMTGPNDDDYKRGIKDIAVIHKSRLRDLDDKWFSKIPKVIRPQGHIFLPVQVTRKPGQLGDDAAAVRAVMIDQLQRYFKLTELMAICSMSRPRCQKAIAELEQANKITRLAKTPQYDVYCLENSPGHKAILLELKIKTGDGPDMGLPDVL